MTDTHVALLALLALVPLSSALSVADVTTLQNQLVGLINSTSNIGPQGTVKYPLIPAFVRLAFHDCNSPGGCDGCLNLNIASNKGLGPAVNSLEALYTNTTLGIRTKISRADFWALAGMVAAQYGAKLQKPPPNVPVYVPSGLVPTSSFKTGRIDCSTGPNGNETDASFPDGINGATQTLAFFSKFYNMSANESVAILGAHTLGKARVENSGFQNPWVPGDNILNNAYYRDMANANAGWAQVKVPQSGKIQWSRNDTVSGNALLMLNADMCLYKAINLNSTGGSSCSYSSCPYATATYQKVNTYAGNNKQWIDDFALAFAKMQNVCGRTSTSVPLPCKLSALTAAAAVRTADGTEAVAAGPRAGDQGAANMEEVAAAGAAEAAAPGVGDEAAAASAQADPAAGAAAAPEDPKQGIAEAYGLGDVASSGGKRRSAARRRLV